MIIMRSSKHNYFFCISNHGQNNSSETNIKTYFSPLSSKKVKLTKSLEFANPKLESSVSMYIATIDFNDRSLRHHRTQGRKTEYFRTMTMAFEKQSNTNCLKKRIGDRDYIFRFLLGNTKWNFLIVSYHRRQFASTGAELDVSRWPNNCFRRIYLRAYVGNTTPKVNRRRQNLLHKLPRRSP